MDPSSRAPATLRWAVRLLWLEALAACAVTAVVGHQAVAGGATSRVDSVALAGFVLLLAAALAGLALALARQKARARAPAIVLQLFGVMSGVMMLGNGPVWLAVPLVVAGVLVTTLLVIPATATALGESSASRPGPG